MGVVAIGTCDQFFLASINEIADAMQIGDNIRRRYR
jgi:hypothetical protein